MPMDYGLSEVQEMLRRTAREFFENECPRELVREIEDQEQDRSVELERRMAELGFWSIAIPEAYGGVGGDLRDLVVFCEEAGRALLPGPYFTTMAIGAPALLALGTEAQKRELLPQVAQGNRTLTLALTEQAWGYRADAIETSATLKDGQFIIDGRKTWVPNGTTADYLIVVARTNPSAPAELGTSLLLVEARSPEVSVRPFHTMAGERLSEVTFHQVRVPQANLLGTLNRGWYELQPILDQAKIAQCAWMIGGAQRVMEMTVFYAKERVQFGRPIGSFQDQQKRIAFMWMAVDGARLQTYKVASTISQGQPATLEAAMAKVTASEAYRFCTYEGIHVHGGVGYMKEFDLQLFYRRAKAGEVFLGNSDLQKDLVADTLLGKA